MLNRRMWVRPSRHLQGGDDFQKFAEWAKTTPNNCFDEDVLYYPTTTVLCAFCEGGEQAVFIPVQRPIMLESLAINPAIRTKENKGLVAVALKALVSNIVMQAGMEGVGELYFLCKDDSTREFAEKNGFKKVDIPVYSLKLINLEAKE